MHAPEQQRVRWRWLAFAAIAFVVALVAFAGFLHSTHGWTMPYLDVFFPVRHIAQAPSPLTVLLSGGVTAVSTVSGLVSIVRFLADVRHAWRKRQAKQPVPVDKARAT